MAEKKFLKKVVGQTGFGGFSVDTNLLGEGKAVERKAVPEKAPPPKPSTKEGLGAFGLRPAGLKELTAFSPLPEKVDPATLSGFGVKGMGEKKKVVAEPEPYHEEKEKYREPALAQARITAKAEKERKDDVRASKARKEAEEAPTLIASDLEALQAFCSFQKKGKKLCPSGPGCKDCLIREALKSEGRWPPTAFDIPPAALNPRLWRFCNASQLPFYHGTEYGPLLPKEAYWKLKCSGSNCPECTLPQYLYAQGYLSKPVMKAHSWLKEQKQAFAIAPAAPVAQSPPAPVVAAPAAPRPANALKTPSDAGIEATNELIRKVEKAGPKDKSNDAELTRRLAAEGYQWRWGERYGREKPRIELATEYFTINVRGHPVDVTYESESGPGGHLEYRSKNTTVVSETGYRSHFFFRQELKQFGGDVHKYAEAVAEELTKELRKEKKPKKDSARVIEMDEEGEDEEPRKRSSKDNGIEIKTSHYSRTLRSARSETLSEKAGMPFYSVSVNIGSSSGSVPEDSRQDVIDYIIDRLAPGIKEGVTEGSIEFINTAPDLQDLTLSKLYNMAKAKAQGVSSLDVFGGKR